MVKNPSASTGDESFIPGSGRSPAEGNGNPLQYPDFQYLFNFECRGPDTLEATQYTWTVLPQGFRDSPCIFGNVLGKQGD